MRRGTGLSTTRIAQRANTDDSRRERRHASSRQPIFVLAVQARKLSFLGALGWVDGGSPNTPCAIIATAMQLSKYYRILHVLSLGPRVAWLIDLVQRLIGLATNNIIFEAPPPGYAVLWSVAWARLLPWSLLVEVHVLSARSWSSPRIVPSCRGSGVAHREYAMSSRINSQIDLDYNAISILGLISFFIEIQFHILSDGRVACVSSRS